MDLGTLEREIFTDEYIENRVGKLNYKIPRKSIHE